MRPAPGDVLDPGLRHRRAAVDAIRQPAKISSPPSPVASRRRIPGTPIRNVEGAAGARRAPLRRRTRAERRGTHRRGACARAGRRSPCCEERHHGQRAIVLARPHCLDVSPAAETRPSCVITAPFGAPVLPDVKLMSAWVAGPTALESPRRATGPDRRPAGIDSRKREQRRGGAPGARRRMLQELLVGEDEARLQQRDLLLQLVRAQPVAERRRNRSGVEAREERGDRLDRVEPEDRDAIAGPHAVMAQTAMERHDKLVQVAVAERVRRRRRRPARPGTTGRARERRPEAGGVESSPCIYPTIGRRA